jgi:hypothetical protein
MAIDLTDNLQQFLILISQEYFLGSSGFTVGPTEKRIFDV